jgi:hypothetical protein
MAIISRVIVCLMILFVSSCAPPPVDQTQVGQTQVEQTQVPEAKQKILPKEKPSMIKIKQLWQQVTVKHINLEGGFYGLVSENGSKLLPMKLPAKYRVDGTILRVKGEPIDNIATIQQWGTPFKLIDIELIKLGSGSLSTH